MKRSTVPWTPRRFAMALVRIHAFWKRDAESGKPAGKPFLQAYLIRHGLQRATTNYRRQGRFAAIIASCSDEIRRDWVMPRRPWTEQRYRRALIQTHAKWKRDKISGKPAGKPFQVVYLYRNGLQKPTTMYRRTGRFAEILASCTEEVRRDWQEPQEWDAKRIEDEFRAQFAAWKEDPHGRPWSQSFIDLSRRGRALLRLLNDYDGLRPEGFLRRIGGEIWTSWRRLLNPWDPDRSREQLRTAVRRWHANGRYNGKRFNYAYLHRNGFAATAKIVSAHYPGGLQRFVHTIPEVSANWSYQRSPANPELRDQLVRLYRVWRTDPLGRLCGRPFGKHYLHYKGAAKLEYHVWNRGLGRILRGPRYEYIRRAWGRRIPAPRDS